MGPISSSSSRSARRSAPDASRSSCRSARVSGLLRRPRCPRADRPTHVAEGLPDAPFEAYRMVVEQIVETDEILMERYLEGESIPPETAPRRRPSGDPRRPTRADRLRLGKEGDRRPRDARPPRRNQPLTPDEVHRFGHKGPKRTRDRAGARSRKGNWSLRCSRRPTTSFVGKLSVLRIHSGRMAARLDLVNLRTGKTSKPGTSTGSRGRPRRRSRRRSRATSSPCPSSTTCTSPTP